MDKEKPTIFGSIIDEEKSKLTLSSSKTSITVTTVRLNNIHPRRRIVQNFLLIWLAVDIDQSKEDFQNTLTKLRTVVNDINIFTQADECVDFLTDIDDMKAFLIVEGTVGQHIVPLIHDIPQLDTIYISYDNESIHEQWTKHWAKIKGVHTNIKPIYEALQSVVKQRNQDSIVVSFVSASENASDANLNQLEPSFMYTQIFKEILLEMEHDEKSIKNFLLFWRDYYINNTFKLNVIAEFERDYCPQSSVRWYTREYFVYQMLNRALRTLEADILINMGFFIRDLHQQIEILHQEQLSNYHGKSFIVYRGQGLLKTDFEKLLKSKNGLISFNNFLSTSPDRDVSLGFAMAALGEANVVGILFEMSIDPSVSSAPFASIREVSYYRMEEEILFSMHTVFRIAEITTMNNDSSLYQVNLKLTVDDDQELRTLTERIRKEVVGEKGWHRLGQLMIKLSQFDKAAELYDVLLEQTSDEGKKAIYYHNSGYIKCNQGDYERAIEYYEKGLEIWQRTLPPNHHLLANSYNSIGLVYQNVGEYSKAISFYQKAIEIQQETLPQNHHLLANFYNNIGGVYTNKGEYSKALSFYQKAFEIKQEILPSNHPSLATAYNNIAIVYDNMREYSKAVSFYKKALDIRQRTLPSNHPDLAASYNNIGLVYDKMGEYPEALSFYEKALEIDQKIRPGNHPFLASSYHNIGAVYKNKAEYSKALSFHEKALEIRQNTFHPNHPDLAISYNNTAGVYYHMGEYSKALSSYQKAIEIYQNTSPPNHPELTTSYNNIAEVYRKMSEYPEALSSHEKALKIRQKLVPPNHPDMATSYSNIGELYRNMSEYPKALSSHEKALEIRQNTFHPNHPDIATSYNNIAAVYYKMGEYSKALSFYQRALNILQHSLPVNHPHAQSVLRSIEIVKKNL